MDLIQTWSDDRFHCTTSTTNDNNRNSRLLIISTLRHELSPTRTLKWPGRYREQITCNTSGAHHVRHVVRQTVRRDSSAVNIEKV